MPSRSDFEVRPGRPSLLLNSPNCQKLKLPIEPATGRDPANVPTLDKMLAVIRLPAGCFPSLPDGTQLKAVGTPTNDGVLDARLVQAAG